MQTDELTVPKTSYS